MLMTDTKSEVINIYLWLQQTFNIKNKTISCIPDKDICVFYLDRQFLSHPCEIHPGPDKNYMYLIHWLYRKSPIYVVK